MAAEPEEVRPAGEGEEDEDDSDEELPMLHKRVDLVYCGGACAYACVSAPPAPDRPGRPPPPTQTGREPHVSGCRMQALIDLSLRSYPFPPTNQCAASRRSTASSTSRTCTPTASSGAPRPTRTSCPRYVRVGPLTSVDICGWAPAHASPMECIDTTGVDAGGAAGGAEAGWRRRRGQGCRGRSRGRGRGGRGRGAHL